MICRFISRSALILLINFHGLGIDWADVLNFLPVFILSDFRSLFLCVFLVVSVGFYFISA